MTHVPLDEAIAALTNDVESGDLPRVVTADHATLDAIRYVVQQWYAITDNAGLDLSSTAEDVAREYFVRGELPDEPWVWQSSL